MCKLKKALAKADFEAIASLSFTVNDVESIITDAENALEDDKNLCLLYTSPSPRDP